MELSIKKSYPIAAKITGPGPAAYFLPSAIGWDNHIVTRKRWPAYSMRIQLKIPDFTHSPGPAAYGYPSHLLSTGMMLDPAYTMRVRPKDFKPPVVPSPDCYNVLPDVTLPRAPAWYMALPALKDKPNGYPAPNAEFLYSVPALLGSHHPCVSTAPEYTMRTKLLVGSIFEDFCKTPGAGRYAVVPLEVIKTRAPIYSLRQRYDPLKGLNVPGPGTYNVGLENKPRSPIYTMRIKHSAFEAPVYVKEPDIMIDWE